MAQELLKEAIADAKAVREVALQNAKMALEEAFDSKIKSMLSAKLAEEIEEDVELEEEYIEEEAEATDEGMSYEEDDKDAANEEFDLDEEINLDELMAELEEMSDDVTEGDEVELEEGDLEESFFGNIAKKIKDTIGGPVGRAESAFIEKYKADFDKLAQAEKTDDNDTLRTLQPKLQSALNSWLPGAYKEFGVDNSNDQKLLKNNLKDIITNVNPDDQRGMMQKLSTGASAGRQKVSADLVGEGDESFDIDALISEIEAELEEGKKKEKEDEEKEKMKEELAEALSTVKALKSTISEMNLLNSKLLYCNKLFRANALTEAQKVKVVDALDKATTTGEAKLVFETLEESFAFTGVEKKAIKEGLGRASKPAGVAPKKVITESVDETVSRFQKLANIKF